MAVIKGVEDNYEEVAPIDSILFEKGEPVLHDDVANYAIPGVELISSLNTGIHFLDPLTVYAPKRGSKINVANPSAGFMTERLFSSGLIFAVNQQKYDASYILTSLQFARQLFQYDKEVSSVAIRLKENVHVRQAKRKIQRLLGSDFIVQDRYE